MLGKINRNSLPDQFTTTFMDLARLIRLPLCIAAGVATVSSMVLAVKFQDPNLSLLAIILTFIVQITSGFIISFLIVGSSNAINDYSDFDIDLLNKRKDRPLTHGRLSKDLAKKIALSSAIIALVWTLIAFDLIVFALTTGFVILSFLYSLKLKKIMLVGNFVVAVCTAAPYILGALAVGLTNLPAVLIILSFVSIILTGTFSREIIKDAWDIKGDKELGIKTLPNVVGIRKSAVVTSVILIITLIISMVTAILYFSDNWPFLFILLLTNLLLLFASFRLLLKPEVFIAKQGRYITRVALLIGVVAFMVASISGLRII
ncbi:MAG: UbiA family prenyltransferase [Candidatus Hodarchaeales archaeon]